jgi:hypothetical protein
MRRRGELVHWRVRAPRACTPWHHWVSWARTVLASVSLSLAKGWRGHYQERVGILQDMVEVRGEGRGDEWQGEWHGTRHGHGLVLSLL